MDIERIIAQLKIDEGFSPNAYWDISRWSIGFGTWAKGRESVISYKEAEKERIEDLMKINRGEMIICTEDFAQDLEEYFNAEKKNIHNAIIERNISEEGFDKELDAIRKDIAVTENFIKKVTEGLQKISAVLAQYLNRAA